VMPIGSIPMSVAVMVTAAMVTAVVMPSTVVASLTAVMSFATVSAASAGVEAVPAVVPMSAVIPAAATNVRSVAEADIASFGIRGGIAVVIGPIAGMRGEITAACKDERQRQSRRHHCFRVSEMMSHGRLLFLHISSLTAVAGKFAASARQCNVMLHAFLEV
jgi:hypothetical protein